VEGGTRLPEIVARVLPAVVSITTREIADTQFNRQVVRRGLGSGFIIDPRGYILTNHHVVEGAPEIKVALADGRRFLATLVGADRFSDLAVLKIDAKALPVLRVGDSRRLRVAETVIAIGNPLWLEGGPTVTVGIVSALGRSMEEDGLPVRHDLVQTDAAINPGNSGGPLIDVRGRVVGINTAIVPSAHGIGFAISIDQVKPIVKRLLAGGRVERASPGFAGVTVTPQLAWANDLAVERGVLVTRVDRPDGAPGVVTGDIVTAVDGESIATLHQLHDVLARHRAGETVELTVRRAAAVVHLRAVLEAER
jgi:serine protease Do